MPSLKDTDLGVTQLPRTNNSVFNLPLKITRVADVLTCSDSSFHTMGAKKQKKCGALKITKHIHITLH